MFSVQDRIRQLHRELLKQVRKLYNTPRLVDMLVHGLASKNNRTRVEAAEAIGEIIHDEGVHVADKARHKPLAALAQVSGLASLYMQHSLAPKTCFGESMSMISGLNLAVQHLCSRAWLGLACVGDQASRVSSACSSTASDAICLLYRVCSLAVL